MPRKTILSGNWLIQTIFCLLIALSGCSSPPPKVESPLSGDQQIALARRMTASMDRSLRDPKLKRLNPVVEKFVASLLNRLAQEGGTASASPDSLHPQLHILKTEKILIGAGLDQRVYISIGLLQAVKFENELAFLLAGQIALLRKKVPQTHLVALQGQALGEASVALPMNPLATGSDALDSKWFESNGFFDFGTEAYLLADKEAIPILNNHQYDPRGAVSFLERAQSEDVGFERGPLGKILPSVAARLETVRNEVAKVSPLRDPIVKSSGFERFLRALRAKQNVDGDGKNKG